MAVMGYSRRPPNVEVLVAAAGGGDVEGGPRADDLRGAVR